MEPILTECPQLEGTALSRAETALAQRLENPMPLDIKETEARLAALL